MSKIVIAVTSSVLFDTSEMEQVYRENGVNEYHEKMAKLKDVPLSPGPAFSLIKKLLSIPPGLEHNEKNLVEVIILSRNSAQTGERVVNSIMNYGLPIHRCVFTDGHNPSRFARAFNVDLFLSSRESEVRKSISMEIPAGLVVGGGLSENESCLMFAVDLDGVVIDDESETVYKTSGLEEFTEHEKCKANVRHNDGLLSGLLKKLSRIRALDNERCHGDKHERMIKLALVTARSADSSHRVLTTLESMGVVFDFTAYMAGGNKGVLLNELGPDVFIDDQMTHLRDLNCSGVYIHLPFGIANKV